MTHEIQPQNQKLEKPARLWMRRWLVLLGLLVYAMILVGGATRLTDSGLSITEWKPISGALPPMTHAHWQELFDLYKQTTEYQVQNSYMTLQEFEFIYWWEWAHRFLGRFVGLVAIIGFVTFLAFGWLKNGWAARFGLLIVLGGLQGAIGWWMVASGIGETDLIDVAAYRLMTHFCLALLIIGIIVWYWMRLGTAGTQRTKVSFPWFLSAFTLLIFVQMASGALVAGLDAGRTYTDWPTMDGDLIPAGYWAAELGVRNIFENVATTQFNHRLIAYLIAILSVVLFIKYKDRVSDYGLIPLIAAIGLQIVWGVATLMNAAPLELALIHQAIGVLVLIASIRSTYKAYHYSPV